MTVPYTSQSDGLNQYQGNPDNSSSNGSSGSKYSTLYISQGSASQMIGEILYSPADTIDKLREAISIECNIPSGFIMKISSHTIEAGQKGYDLVSNFLNPDFPVVIVNPN